MPAQPPGEGSPNAARVRAPSSWSMVTAASVAIALAAALLLFNWQQDRALTEIRAVDGAADIADVLRLVRERYTDVVHRLEPHGIEARHDYADADRAIPLPATLTFELSSDLRERAEVRADLYSPHPFPWRAQTGGLRDDFQQQAWAALEQDPSTPYLRFVEGPEGVVLRYATADLLRPTCVGCHNTHPESPKRDWKVGDVRGVLEVKIPMDRARTQVTQMAFTTATMLGILGAMALLGLGLFLRWQRRNHERLEHLVDERTAELRASMEQAESATRAKSAFLATMSHELRTPLNSVIGFSKVLLKNKHDRLGPKELDHARRIHTNGGHLLELINEVLDISKIESDQMMLQPTECSVADVVGALIELQEHNARERGLTLLAEVPSPLRPIYVDEVRLRQVLLNLLGNAIKFTEEGSVTVRLKRHPGTHDLASIEVIDTGIGISSEALSSIFDPFWQADGTTARRFGGSGLGLAITRALCQKMGFRLEVDSTPGEGSCFRVDVPRSASTDRPPTDADKAAPQRASS